MCARSLCRSRTRTPWRRRAAECAASPADIAFGEVEPPARSVGAGTQHRAAVLARDLSELVTRRSCNLERAGRERDLDLRAEQLRPGEPVPTLLRQCLRDAGRRRVLTPLREPQQRKAGLGVHAELGRA